LKTIKRKPKLDFRKIRESHDRSFRYINKFYKTEIEPIIKMLPNKEISNELRQSLKKYLIISLISSMEYFFRNEAKNIVDNNDMDITRLLSGEISFSMSELDILLKNKYLTKGNIIASSFDFAKLDEVNDLFSKLLDLDFLDYVHKLNDIDQTRFVLDGHSIPIEYGKLKEAHQIRNEIVHELKDINLSNWKILSLWDNLLAIMDISVSIFLSASDPNLRSSLDSDYEWGIERENRKRIYKLYSEKIIQYLNEKGQIPITKDQNGYNISANEIRLSSDDEALADNIKWIISRMLKEKLIEIHSNNMYPTSKGAKRLKKVTKKIDSPK
jgi:hypothetical protein